MKGPSHSRCREGRLYDLLVIVAANFRDSYRHREVNSFQFPDEELSHGGGDSPELGIREVC